MLFLAGIVFLVGAVITSQTLVAAVIGSIREYATLNALGVGVGDLRKVVMEQAFWVGALGLLGADLLGIVLMLLAPAEMCRCARSCRQYWPASCLVMGLAACLGPGRHAQPAPRRPRHVVEVVAMQAADASKPNAAPPCWPNSQQGIRFRPATHAGAGRPHPGHMTPAN